jgi:hypothetical protein
MKNYSKIGLFFVLGGVLTFGSCLKPEEFPPTPEIEYVSFVAMQDSANLTISFTDGDGDIGLHEYETDAPFDFNLYMEYYEKDDQLGWIRGKDLDGNDISFNYRVPYITPDGQNKALQGEIRITMEPSYYNWLSPESDSVRYRIMLKDRSLKESNWIWSPPIYNGIPQE